METLRSERSMWLWVLLWRSVVGLIGSVVWAFFSYGGLQDRLAELPRSAVPGQVEVEVSEPQALTIFYEDPTAEGMFLVRSSDANVLEAPPVDLTVVGPAGERIQSQPYDRDLRFDHNDRVLIAVATIETASVGTYAIQVSGDVPVGAQISVGDVIDFGLVANIVAVVGLFVVSILGSVVAVVLLTVRSGSRPSQTRADRSLVGV